MSKEVKFTDEEVETIQKIRDSFDANRKARSNRNRNSKPSV